MSRFRRVIHGVASGYLLLAVTAVYALASVPVALHYLSKERFGLWTLMSAIAGYLSLVDVGMSSSVARLLIDHKDDPKKGNYGSLIKTGWLVLGVQGAVAFVAGFALSSWIAELLLIPQDLRADFIALLRWQSLGVGLSFGSRIFMQILNAHQRMDLSNYFMAGSLVMNFALLWGFFHIGCDVFSLAWASLLTTFGGAVICWAACFRLRLVPPAGAWGRASWSLFRELFAYGKDLFLVALGTQMILASQAMIITRQLGLESAATWNVGTRTFSLVAQAIWRIFDASAPALSEMMVRGERRLLRDRYRSIVVLTAAVSGFAAVTFALCNSTFVTVWTNHKIFWAPLNDLLLGVWMIVTSLLHCHNSVPLLAKNVGAMRYIYFIEGLVFIALAYLAAPVLGLPGIIASSVFCSSVFSGAYGVWRITKYFGFTYSEVALGWLGPMGRLLLLFSPLAALVALVGARLPEPWMTLAIKAVIGGGLGACLFLRFGLTPSLQRELLERAPRRFNSILRRAFAAPALT